MMKKDSKNRTKKTKYCMIYQDTQNRKERLSAYT